MVWELYGNETNFCDDRVFFFDGVYMIINASLVATLTRPPDPLHCMSLYAVGIQLDPYCILPAGSAACRHGL